MTARKANLYLILLLTLLMGCRPSSKPALLNEATWLESPNEEALASKMPPKSILLTPDQVNIAIGQRQPIACLGIFPYGVRAPITEGITWSFDPPELASIDTRGVVVAEKIGTTTLTASYRGIQASIVLQIADSVLTQLLIFPQKVQIELSPQPAGYRAQNFSLETFGLFSDGQLRNLSDECRWLSENSQGVSVISEDGQFLAKTAGSYKINSSCRNMQTERTVEIVNKKPRPVKLSFADSPMVLIKGESKKLEPIITYEDGSSVLLTDGVRVSGLDSIITREGLYLNSIATGEGFLSVGWGDFEAKLLIQVIPPKIVGLRFEPAGFNISIGLSYFFRVVADLSDGTTEDVSSAASLDSVRLDVATVEAALVRVRGVANGTGQLRARLSGMETLAPVIVGPAIVEQLYIEPSTLSVVAGYTTQFRVMARYSDGSHLDLTSVAVASPVSLIRAEVSPTIKGLLTGKTQGSTTLSASYIDPVGRNFVASVPLTVEPPKLVTLTLDPSSASVPLGRTQDFRVRGRYSDQTEKDLTTVVKVMANISSPYLRAGNLSLSSEGRIRFQASSIGQMLLQVTHADIEASALIDATDKVIDSVFIVRITPAAKANTITLGDTARFRAHVKYSDATSEDITRSTDQFTVGWGSPSANVASLVLDGNDMLFTAISEGDAQLLVTFDSPRGNRSATFNLGVYSPCPSPGKQESYYCMYIGDAGQSCTDSCSALSRSVHPATISFLGHDGTEAICQTTLTNHFSSVMKSFNSGASSEFGVGCAIFSAADLNIGIHEEFYETTADAADPNFRRVCACR